MNKKTGQFGKNVEQTVGSLFGSKFDIGLESLCQSSLPSEKMGKNFVQTKKKEKNNDQCRSRTRNLTTFWLQIGGELKLYAAVTSAEYIKIIVNGSCESKNNSDNIL